MVGHFGDRVLGQMDLCSGGVLLFSGSWGLICFSKGESSGISENEYKEKKKNPWGNEQVLLPSKRFAVI